MVNLVIVSHSARLGEGVGELARQMLINDGCKLAIAAGIDDPDSPIGTDPLKVMEAIESVADTDHVLVMMDIGSALLSAETALDLLDPAIAAKVRLCAAPLVEGTLAATVSAASGAGIDKVIADAMSALEAKRVQLGLPSPTSDAAPAPTLADDGDTKSVSVIINNHNGLHVRPASKLVAALAGFNADLLLEKNGKCVKPDSLNQIALLQVRRNDTLKLLASGPDADAALEQVRTIYQSSLAHLRESMQRFVADVLPFIRRAASSADALLNAESPYCFHTRVDIDESGKEYTRLVAREWMRVTRGEDDNPEALASIFLFVATGFPAKAQMLQREARALIDASGRDIRLEIDGGVNVNNIREIAAAGADTFVAGSAIFGKPDYKAVIDAMRAELAKVAGA